MKFNLSSINGTNIKKGLNYIKYNGFSGIWSRVRYKMSGPGLAYNSWYKEQHETDIEELARQRNEEFSYEPLISILVPVFMTPERYLRDMIESVCAQTYYKWQLCIVDGSQAVGTTDETKTLEEKIYSLETEQVIRQYMEKDARIEYKLLENNLGISDNTNEALAMARGEYIALLDHDDILTEDALYNVVKALQDEKYDAIYSDEDKMSEDGGKYSDPAFKPDFNIDLLRAHNYITHFFVTKRELANSVGGFSSEYDGAQDYDFILKCCENSNSIKHIPRVLYHWRINNKSVASDAYKKDYAKEAGRKALGAHLKRKKCFATVVNTEMWGIYKVMYETPGNPLLTIVVLGSANVQEMKNCLNPLFERARYSNFEIIVVDTVGDDKELLDFYRKIEARRKNLRVITKKTLSSMPEARNFGAQHAKGDYILFIDGNMEILAPTAMGEMLGICMRDEVGAVAGSLYNDNNLTTYGPIAFGVNKIASYVYQGLKKGDFGYLMHNRVSCDYSAVSANCFMIKKSIFNKLGGFSDKFKTQLSDMDFCLKIRELNKLIVYAPEAEWSYHKPSETIMKLQAGVNHEVYLPMDISGETNPENVAMNKFEKQMKAEEGLFEIFWNKILTEGDPYYNPNFALEGDPFTLNKEKQ